MKKKIVLSCVETRKPHIQESLKRKRPFACFRGRITIKEDVVHIIVSQPIKEKIQWGWIGFEEKPDDD